MPVPSPLRLVVALLLTTIIAGCPSKPKDEEKTEPEAKFTEKDDADAVKLLDTYKVRMAKYDFDAGENIDSNVTTLDFRTVEFQDDDVDDKEEMTKLFEAGSKLPYIAFVVASRPEVTDDAMKYVAEWDDLRQLELVQSGISDEGLKHLSDLKKLNTLNLQKADVGGKGLQYLKDVESLEILDLRSTRTDTSGMEALAKLKNLEALHFETTIAVTNEGLEKIADLENLTDLTLTGTQFNDDTAKIVANFKKLKRLTLDTSKVTAAGLEEISGLKELQLLSLRWCNEIDDSAMEHVAKLENLTTLKIRSTVVGDDGLAKLKGLKLKALDLQECAVTDAGLESLGKMESLQKLELWQAAIESGEVLQNFPNLTVLDLRWTYISDETMADIAKLEKLKVLLLAQCEITDEGLLKLKNAEALRRVDVSNILAITPDAIEELKEAKPEVKVTMDDIG